MTDINQVTAHNSPPPPPPPAPSGPGIGEEYNTFLRLLTAQIRNQDPLAPLDSTQFVEQLATFSSLEQQVRGNSSLENIAEMLSSLLSTIANEWIGTKVAIKSSWAPYTSQPIQFQTDDIPKDADRAVLTIRDTSGEVAWTEALDLKANTYSWDGRTQSGVPASPDSLYQFNIDIYRKGELAGSVIPRIVTTVTDIANENGKLRIGTTSHLTTDLGNARKVLN